MDKAASHISKDSVVFLGANKVNYVFIPSGMTPACQSLDISVNKIFKDNVKFLFEKERLYYDNINPKIKLKQARLNLVNYIYEVWYNDTIITKNIIINCFNKAGIINQFYTTSEEDKITELYRYDILDKDNEILDDLGDELKLNPDEINDEKENNELFDELMEIKNYNNKI